MIANEQSQADGFNRWLAFWEIASVAASALIALWVIQVFARHRYWIGAIPVVLAIGLMLFSHRVRRESPRELGFRLDNFIPALRLLVIPTVTAVAVILLAAWLYNGSVSVAKFRPRLLLVPVWVLFQQYALQGFVNRRAQILSGAGTQAALITGLVFCALHLPSPLLAILTVTGGFVWALVYQRQPNLFALTVSHTIMSWVLSLLLPLKLVPTLRLGFKYFGIVLF